MTIEDDLSMMQTSPGLYLTASEISLLKDVIMNDLNDRSRQPNPNVSDIGKLYVIQAKLINYVSRLGA